MKKEIKIFTLVLITGFFCVSSLYASGPDLLLKSIRQISMGGTAVAISHDENALYQNPACLNKIEGFKFTLIDIGVDLNDRILGKYNIINQLFKTKDTDEITNLITELTPTQLGVIQSARALSLGWKNFAFGIFGRGISNGYLLRPADPYIKATSMHDAAGLIGLSSDLDIFGFKFVGGISGGYLSRFYGYDKNTGDTTLVYGLGSMVNVIKDGKTPTNAATYILSGLNVNVGALKSFESFLGPKTSLGFVVKNIGSQLSGNKTLADGSIVKVRENLPLTTVVGLGFKTDAWFFEEYTWAIDYDVISAQNNFYQKIHAGVETGLFNGLIKLRGGINQGYLVGGLGLNLWILHIDYAYNKESVGNQIGLDENGYHLLNIGLYF